MTQVGLTACRNNSGVSPAVKPVLEEVKQGFLHHVRHLRKKKKTRGSLTFVTRIVRSYTNVQLCPAALAHLVTFEGGAHQHHRPHGGNHIVWGHVLRLSMTSHPSEDSLPATDSPPRLADLP